jgi:hypothetical protein
VVINVSHGLAAKQRTARPEPFCTVVRCDTPMIEGDGVRSWGLADDKLIDATQNVASI